MLPTKILQSIDEERKYVSIFRSQATVLMGHIFGPNVANLQKQWINVSYISKEFDYRCKEQFGLIVCMFECCVQKVYKALMNKKDMFQMR